MARMMPAFCPTDAPPGEKALHEHLHRSGGTDDWIVLHSLGIADHVRQVEGEADFVVIVPHAGILVIEVKSHRSVSYDGSTWRLGHDAPTARGPFQQAREAMHSLRAHLQSKSVELRSVPVLSAVWFTEVRARTTLPASPEWHDWQVLDSTDLPNAPSAILRTLAAGTAHLDDKITHFSYGGPGPDRDLAERIARHFRPRFELVTFPGDRRRARESQLRSFVDEQFAALDSLSDNQSVLFSGPAGAGKTLLALEATRRETLQGRRGRLLCFNRLISTRLRADLADLDTVTVGTLHQELLRLSGLHQAPQGAAATFWNQELPERAIEALLEGDEAPGDFLVVDEVQDIATDAYLDVFDLMVEGGLKEGRVLLFGDFEHQAIYESRTDRERLRARAPQMASYRLTYNCRNLPRIGQQVNQLSHLEPGYQQFRRLDDGVEPTFHPYRSGQDQSTLLVAVIRGLQEDGYDLSEIVVLSPHRQESTAATTTDPWLQQILAPVDGMPPGSGQVQYATIHAFKGLEAPAVVLTDLDHAGVATKFDALLYVGLTRATDRLVALIETQTLRRARSGAV